jgi:hypothetical protein
MPQFLKKGPLLALCLLFSLSACYRLTTRVPSDKPILLNSQPELQGNVQKFSLSGSQAYFFWGLVGNDNTVIQTALLKELEEAKGLQNVKIKMEFSFTDMLLGSLTLGIFTPRSFTITGERVQ